MDVVTVWGKVQKHACGGERKCFASSGSVSSGRRLSLSCLGYSLCLLCGVPAVCLSPPAKSAPVGWIRFRPVEGQRGLVVHPLRQSPSMSKRWSKLPVGSCRPYSATRGTKTLQWVVSSCSSHPFPLVRRALSTRLFAAASCVGKLLKCRKNMISPFTATALVRISRVESGNGVSA